jgi:hypothetical protein
MKVRLVALVLIGAATLSPVRAVSASGDIDRDLEAGKALVREAKFAQAVATLHGVVVRLEQAGEARALSARLGEAHLHLALAYLALDDPAAATESLKALARADPARRLDPDVYAPKVIELLREARSQVEHEAPDSRQSAEEAAAGTTERGRSRAPLILAIAGAGAAGTAAALAAGGRDAKAPARATTSPTPVPAPSAATPAVGPEVAFVGSAPAPGSQVSVNSSLQLTFTLTSGRDLAAHALHVILAAPESGHPAFSGADCHSVHTASFPLRAGESRSVTVEFHDQPRTCTPLPFTTTVVGAALEPCDVVPTCMDFGRAAVVRYFNLAYTLVP